MIYYKKFIEFLKNNNLYEDESFIYISRQTTNIDYDNEEEKQNIGCQKEIKDNKLKKFKVCVPEIKDEKTLLININNYVKALYLYQMLGKEYKEGIEEEIMGLLYEKIYIITQEDISAKEYNKQVEEEINEIGTNEIKQAHQIAEELLKENYSSMVELSTKTRQKVKK